MAMGRSRTVASTTGQAIMKPSDRSAFTARGVAASDEEQYLQDKKFWDRVEMGVFLWAGTLVGLALGWLAGALV